MVVTKVKLKVLDMSKSNDGGITLISIFAATLSAM